MAVGFVGSAVGTNNLAPAVRALASVPSIDYADRFTLFTEAVATPEQWARALLGDVPNVAQVFVWRGLLGLRLSPGRSTLTVAGWRIGERGEGWIRLEASSWFVSADLLVQTAADRVSLGTFVHYKRTLGQVVWSPLSAVHRRVVPVALRNAADRVRRRQGENGQQ